MNNKLELNNSMFDSIKHVDEYGNEYWYARELMNVLDYKKWERFNNVIELSKIACNQSNYDISDHFPEVGKMIEVAKGAKRKILDYKLTRYACYLIVQNGDPRKEVIALAQTYFAIQKRKKNCWNIEINKDIFKNIKSPHLLQKMAYNFILNGNTNFKTITDTIDGKKVKFIRISAREYLYGTNSKKLNSNEYNKKMRIAPSIDDLINNASIKYSSPLIHNKSLFKGGFNNFQGALKIDNVIFKYIVRVGKAKNDNIFYDISLNNLNIEKGTGIKVPSTNSTSPIKKPIPLTEKNISYSKEHVNTNKIK